jgi:hypothetical protein
MLNVDDKKGATLARQANFDFVQGSYFELPATISNSKLLSVNYGEQARF